MSMIGNVARISDDTRAIIHADPTLATTLLYPDSSIGNSAKPSILGRLLRRARPRASLATSSAPMMSDGDTLDIDKTWHAIHYLLTGTAWDGGFPEGFLVSCGEPVGDVDAGMVPLDRSRGGRRDCRLSR